MLKNKNILILTGLLIFAFIIRVININYPNSFYFDEVYHAFTAQKYLEGSKEAWEWWTIPPLGVAYEWTHPPLAKEIMTASMFVFQTTESWAYRLPGVLFGVLGVLLIYLIADKLFKNKKVALLSAFIYSIDGLNFVQSRVGMNDAYFVALMLATVYFSLSKRFFIASIFLGLTIATKWTGLYLFGLVFIITILSKEYFKLSYFIIISPIIYLLSYIPFFLLGHTSDQFIELQKQMWWYHTGLKATHTYASSWWSWPLNLYPVWYFVEYHKNGWMSNIFASGNPAVFWLGFGAILVTIYDFIKTRSMSLLIVLLGYLTFFLPWALSPRIMFLYHYSPSIPFLTLALGYQLINLTDRREDKIAVFLIVLFITLTFGLFYPILTGIPLPKEVLLFFFSTNLTKNPFGG